MKRIKYYDIIRIVCTLMIIWYHALIQLSVDGITTAEKLAPLFSNANMHLATLAVALFFLPSGACQMLSSHKKESLLTYYKKRFLTLLIPFYVTYLFTLIFQAFAHPEVIAYFKTLPKKRILYTFLGMDEWISMHGTPTFTLHIGEWFLGCLIVLNLLFPLFRWLMQKNRHVFMAAATAIYAVIACKYDAFCLRIGTNVPWNMSIVLKGYEFLLGMYLAEELKKLPALFRWLSAAVTVFFFVCPVTIPLPDALKTTVFALSFFIAFSLLEPLLQKAAETNAGGKQKDLLTRISAFTYPLFLTHHIVIYEVTPIAKPYLDSIARIAVLLFAELCLMILTALFVQAVSKKITQ